MMINMAITGKEELMKTLSGMVAKIEHKEEILNRFSIIVVRDIRQTIDQAGYPSGSWPPLSTMTIAMRRKGKGKGSGGASPLKDTLAYYRSFHKLGQGQDYVDVGTVDKRGPKLHFGGMTEERFIPNVKVKSHFATRRKNGFAQKAWFVKAHTRTQHLTPRVIPPRPHVNLTDRAIEKLISVTADYMTEKGIQQ